MFKAYFRRRLGPLSRVAPAVVLGILVAVAAWALVAGEAKRPIPASDGEMCQWAPAGASQSPDRKGGVSEGTGNREQGTEIPNSEFRIPEPDTQHPTPGTRDRALALAALPAAALQERASRSGATVSSKDARTAVNADRAPLRVIRDTYPSYSAVAVDTNSEEVFLQDENLFGLKVFNRLDNTPPHASFTEPKRVLGGSKTKLEYNCGLYIDPNNGDVYSLANDTVDTLVVFPHDAKGNVAPMRQLATPQSAFGLAVDEQHQELFITTEETSSVVVYRKTASGNDAPLREIHGEATQLADPHGVAVDTKNNLLFVNNSGYVYSWSAGRPVPASGKFIPPAITVYPLNASGNTPPLRVIAGPQTQLNWTAGMYVDPEHAELYVANDAGNSILVFREADSGDAAPLRVLKGPRTGLKDPMGVFADLKNGELWVANIGNHTATVYPRTANGDVAPLRTIRSAPAGQLSLVVENPGAVSYDSKREEILVPN